MSDNVVSRTTGQFTHPPYRADIDGLRAIAVLAVVGFHAFPDMVGGGFIGVDVFFVISGFLISTIIFDNLSRNSFSFVEFYSRRIKRIFPALLVVFMACFVFGWFVLFADEYKQLSKHIVRGALFISNFTLWRESGYFDNSAETKPLLHLWSLGIEEQFYIIWPLLLWCAWKRRFNLLSVTLAITAISFALNLWKADSDVVAAFYSPQTRFWELLIGSCLAYLTLFQSQVLRQFKIRNDHVQSFCGAGLLVVGLVCITKERAFPGWWALLPTVGAVLIISAGAQAWFNRAVLSHRLLVWFGLISFPLYLWHWPLLAFARVIESETPSGEVRLAAVALSVVLAWLTYRLIERPVRFGQAGKAWVLGLLGLMLVAGLIAGLNQQRGGLLLKEGRSPQEVKHEGDIGQDIFHDYVRSTFYLCMPVNIRQEAVLLNGSVRCFQSQKDAPADIAIIGDSHAEPLFLGLAEALPARNVVYYFRTSMPFTSSREFEHIFSHVIGDDQIRTVILSAKWSGNGRRGLTMDRDTFRDELAATVARLTAAHKTVYVTDDVPNFRFDPPKCKYERLFSGTSACAENRNYFSHQYDSYYPILESVVRRNGQAKVMNTVKYFCDDRLCTMGRDGKLLYRDRNHLNINGSRYVGDMIVQDHPQLLNR
ncbi:MAG: acyltransferase family protein [Nitrospirae bacterium]|nr:acyltransferase family protein [Nitrospirota bacterium]